LARREGSTAGAVVSRLLRRTLTGLDAGAEVGTAAPTRRVAGFEPFAARAGVLTTNDQVNALREAEGV
jgi:hypothetical protein